MSLHKKLIIIGAGGHGKVLADIAYHMNQWEEICFLDDNIKQSEVLGFKVIGTLKDAIKYKMEADFIVGIGSNSVREKVFNRLKSDGLSITTLIHPSAIIGLDVVIGVGTAIMAGAVLNSSTIIRESAIINTSTTVDHDCVVGEFVHLSPGVNIAGNVSIGERTWIGIGSSVVNNRKICEDVIVGAHSLIVKDILIKDIYFGSPIRSSKK